MRNFIFKLHNIFSSLKEKNNVKKIIILGVSLILISAAAGHLILKKNNFSTTTQAQPIIAAQIDRKFTFTAQDTANKNTTAKNEVNKITFTVVSAEIKDEIKVQNAPRKSPEGKIFLLLRLELNNEATKRLSFLSADYIRLVGSDNKKYSPDFHNGVVIMDPISVRRDLVSFIVNEKDKSFTFLIGELDKDKESIEIKFP